jgi:N-acetylneuraminic acid mutarotase
MKFGLVLAVLLLLPLLLPGCAWFVAGGTAAVLYILQPEGESETAPVVLIAASSRMTSNPASVDFTLHDAEGDLCDITVEYAVGGGGSFHTAVPGPGGSGTTGLGTSPEGVPHVFSWDFSSGPDLTSPETLDVRIRITAMDASGRQGSAVSTSLSLGNAQPVIESISLPAGDVTGTATLSYEISDTQADVAQIEVEFKRETDGTDWATFGQAATPEIAGSNLNVTTASAPAVSDFFPWDSDAPTDMQGEDEDVRIRIRASDGVTPGWGAWLVSTGVVRVRNSSAPRIDLGNIQIAQDGLVYIPYTCADGEGNAVSILAEYLEFGETAWRRATAGPGTTSLVMNATPSGAVGHFVWDSKRDGLIGKSATVRITPSEVNLAGIRGTRDISVGNDGTAQWESRAALPTPRLEFRCVELGGKLYAIGGHTGMSGTYVATMEIYDPVTNTWASGTPMPTPRYRFGCAVLGGKIYAAGGDNGPRLALLEIFDPATGTWSAGPSLPGAQTQVGCAALGGLLFVSGGYNGSFLASLLAFDPATGVWSARAPMSTVRVDHACAAVGGRLLVAGGENASSTYLASVESYDPAADSWSPCAPMSEPKYVFPGGVVGGQMVLFGGWNSSGDKTTVELYDPVADSWRNLQPLPDPIARHHGAVLGGKIYSLGGLRSSFGVRPEVNRLDPVDFRWAGRAPLPAARSQHGSAAAFGKIYAVGGFLGWGNTTATVDVYDPASNSWSAAAPLQVGRYFPCSASVGGKVYAIGGNGGVSALNSVEVYDPVQNNWTFCSPMPTARYECKCAVVGGIIYVLGGVNSTDVEAFDPSADTWTTKASMPTLRWGFDCAPSGGKIYVFGGYDNAFMPPVTYYTAVEIYDPATDSWSTGSANMGTPRIYHRSIAFKDRILVIGGGQQGVTGLNVVEEYDPADDSWRFLPSIGASVRDLGAATIGKDLYVFGGYSAADSVASVQVLRGGMGLPLVVTLEDLDTACAGSALAAVSGNVYRLGGRTGTSTAEASVAAAEFMQDIPASGPFTFSPGFTAVAPMNTARHGAAAVEYNGAIFIVGGTDGSSTLNTLEKFDPVSDSWTLLSPTLSVARQGLGAVRLGDRLYILGGDVGAGTKTAALEVFDLGSESWVSGPFANMNVARSHFGCGLEPETGRIYVFGGEGAGGSFLNSVEFYDPGTDTWTLTANPMPVSVKGALCLREEGQLVLFGGEVEHPTAGSVITDRIWTYAHTGDLWTESERTLPYPARDLTGCTVKCTWIHRGNAQSEEFCLLGGGFDGANVRDGFFRFYTR